MSYCPHQDYGILSELAEKAKEKGILCPDYPHGCDACIDEDDESTPNTGPIWDEDSQRFI